MQVGHETYNDVLVREKLYPSVTSATEFAERLSQLAPFSLSVQDRERFYKIIGYRKDLASTLKSTLQNKSI